jgi:dUTP pyrophosphatase
MDDKQINIYEQIFGALDTVFDDGENADGLRVIGAILALPDEQFEAIKPSLFDSIEATFNEPATKVAFSQMINQQGLRIEDFSDNMDNLIQAVEELTVEDVELSDSKKDFLKFIFATFVNSMEDSKMVSRRVISIPVEVCREGAKLPTYATDGSGAMDIYSPEEYVIGPGESVMIPIGIKVDIPIGYGLLIQPRSGLSRKSKIRIPNTPGLIDSDYHEEIGVIIENIDPPVKDVQLELGDNGEIIDGTLYGSSFTIGKGERFAQMRLVEIPLVNWLPVSSLGSFENDHGKGFGSTGTN